MKGSMKVKFDLGWVFSATLAISLVLFGVARMSLAIEAQDRLTNSCNIFEQEMAETYAIVDKPFTEGLFAAKCLNEYKRSTLSIALDTEKWSYSEIYADAVKTLKH